MILTIDIGNSNTHFGIFHKGKLKKILVANSSQAERHYHRTLKGCIKRINLDFPNMKGVILCSVVPKATRCLETIVKAELRQKCVVVGEDILVPIKNKYSRPKQVGQDRLVGAYAASILYGSPLIIIDLGTAITLDVVSLKKEYLGGIIVPGIRLSLEVLFEETALLPLVKIQKPASIIGRDTKGSILSGIFWGYGAMMNGLIDQLKEEVKGEPKIVLTGGHAKIMKSYLKYDAIIDTHLIMQGLNMMWLRI